MNQIDLLNELSEESSLNQIQEYIKRVVELRGFASQPVQETMLLLLEETGELAKAIRKSETYMSVDVDKMENFETVESEVADIFFVLMAVCNQTGVNLLNALIEKEKKNCKRNWSFEKATVPSKKITFGAMKGMIAIAEDFDEPLECFEEYM